MTTKKAMPRGLGDWKQKRYANLGGRNAGMQSATTQTVCEEFGDQSLTIESVVLECQLMQRRTTMNLQDSLHWIIHHWACWGEHPGPQKHIELSTKFSSFWKSSDWIQSCEQKNQQIYATRPIWHMHSSQNGQHEAHHKPGRSQNGQCEMQPALGLGFHDQLLTLSSCEFRSALIHILHFNRY